MGGDGNMLNAAALQAIGYTDNAPVLRAGHPVWDDTTIRGRNSSAVFVPVDTRSLQSSISDLTNPLFKAFHEALCE